MSTQTAEASNQVVVNAELISQVEQFLFREARLLDERKLQQWMALITEDLEYLMPARLQPTLNPRERGTEEYHSMDRELEREAPAGVPLRKENFFAIAIRVDRAYKVNAWAENPPARTRRFITNIEVEALPNGELQVYSNFQLFFSRHQKDNYTYYGHRKDVLRIEGDSFKIAKREVVLEYNVITVPTLGLIM